MFTAKGTILATTTSTLSTITSTILNNTSEILATTSMTPTTNTQYTPTSAASSMLSTTSTHSEEHSSQLSPWVWMTIGASAVLVTGSVLYLAYRLSKRYIANSMTTGSNDIELSNSNSNEIVAFEPQGINPFDVREKHNYIREMDSITKNRDKNINLNVTFAHSNVLTSPQVPTDFDLLDLFSPEIPEIGNHTTIEDDVSIDSSLLDESNLFENPSEIKDLKLGKLRISMIGDNSWSRD